MVAGSNGIIFDDLDDPLTRVSYLQVEYLKNGVSEGQSYYRTLIGNHVPTLSHGTTFNDLE